jgi:hypothetical protein
VTTPTHSRALPVEELKAAVGEPGNARHGWQQGADKGQETTGQQRQQTVFIKHAGRALMVLMRQMRQPAFHRFGIAQPAPLHIAQPAAEAGGGGKNGDSGHKVHDAFGNERAGEQQQAVPG